MLILPDTSCWIDFFRPQGEVVVRVQMQRWLESGRLAVCGPVRAEVLRGAPRTEAPRLADAFAALTHLDAQERDWEAVEPGA